MDLETDFSKGEMPLGNGLSLVLTAESWLLLLLLELVDGKTKPWEMDRALAQVKHNKTFFFLVMVEVVCAWFIRKGAVL